MKYSLLMVLVLLLSFSSTAHSDVSKNTFCKTVQAHSPRDDVNFQPGVDVHGNSVVSADIDSASAYKFPTSITIPISIDIARRLNANVEGLESFGQFGTVEIKDGNKVFFEGQDISEQAHILCDIAPSVAIEKPVQPTLKPEAQPVEVTLAEDAEVLPSYKAPLVIKEKIADVEEIEVEIIEDKSLFGGYSQDTVNKYNN